MMRHLINIVTTIKYIFCEPKRAFCGLNHLIYLNRMTLLKISHYIPINMIF